MSPTLLIERLSIPPEIFGWYIFLVNGAAALASAWLNSRYVKKLGMQVMIRFGWGIMIFSGIVLWLSKIMFGANIDSIMFPIVLFYFGAGFIGANAFAIAFSSVSNIAGYAGSLYGFI